MATKSELLKQISDAIDCMLTKDGGPGSGKKGSKGRPLEEERRVSQAGKVMAILHTNIADKHGKQSDFHSNESKRHSELGDSELSHLHNEASGHHFVAGLANRTAAESHAQGSSMARADSHEATQKSEVANAKTRALQVKEQPSAGKNKPE